MPDDTKEKDKQQKTDEPITEEPVDKKTDDTEPKPVVKETEKDKGEELAGKDTSKFTTEQMIDYIDNLKDENARRRIANKKLKDSQTKMEKRLAEMEGKLEDATGKLTKVEEEKKKSADAEKSEVERLQGEVEDFKTKLSAMSGEIEENKKVIVAKDREIKKRDRESDVNALLGAAKVTFSSDYERQGFMADLLKIDDDGDFVVNEEEVNYKVGQFVKKAKETKPRTPETPPAGPGTRSVDPALNDRIKALTAKAKEGSLSEEDSTELDELLELAGQAAEWSPRQPGG